MRARVRHILTPAILRTADETIFQTDGQGRMRAKDVTITITRPGGETTVLNAKECSYGPAYPLVWRVKSRLPERKGQRCRILARGAMNTVHVEFEDGYRVFTSGNYLRKSKP